MEVVVSRREYNRKWKQKNRQRVADSMKKWRQKNREKINAYQRQNRHKYRTYHRRFWLNRKYGIALGDFNAMLLAQGMLCALCRKSCATGEALCVDHSHETGKVRGLLCRKCNTGIGLFYEDPRLLRRAEAYIYKHHGDAYEGYYITDSEAVIEMTNQQPSLFDEFHMSHREVA